MSEIPTYHSTRCNNQRGNPKLNVFKVTIIVTLKMEDAGTEIESESKSKITTLRMARGENIKYLPYAFTENGIAMLSGC